VFSSQLSREEGEVIFPISSNLALYASWQKGKDRNYDSNSRFRKSDLPIIIPECGKVTENYKNCSLSII